jgi:hypothetical protein
MLLDITSSQNNLADKYEAQGIGPNGSPKVDPNSPLEIDFSSYKKPDGDPPHDHKG